MNGSEKIGGFKVFLPSRLSALIYKTDSSDIGSSDWAKNMLIVITGNLALVVADALEIVVACNYVVHVGRVTAIFAVSLEARDQFSGCLSKVFGGHCGNY